MKLSGIERIDTTGFGVNKVTLSIQDVIDMTGDNNRLTVIGDKGDAVNLTGLGANNNWQAVGSNGEFTTYAWHDELHAAVVEISNQMTSISAERGISKDGKLGLHVKPPRSAPRESRQY